MISKGLSDGLNRALMKTGFRLWLDFEDAAGTPWIFNPHFLTTLPWVKGFSNDFRPAVTLRRYKQKFKKRKRNGTRNQLN